MTVMAELLVINNIKPVISNNICKQAKLICDTINEFATHLRNDNLELMYNSHGVDLKCSTSLTILRIFEVNFPTFK
jgi:fumarate hydratase class II